MVEPSVYVPIRLKKSVVARIDALAEVETPGNRSRMLLTLLTEALEAREGVTQPAQAVTQSRRAVTQPAPPVTPKPAKPHPIKTAFVEPDEPEPTEPKPAKPASSKADRLREMRETAFEAKLRRSASI